MSVEIFTDGLFREGWLHATLGISAQRKESEYMAGFDMALDTPPCREVGAIMQKMDDLNQLTIRAKL